MKSDNSRETPPCLHTLKVQVLGSCGGLRGDLGVYLDHVEVVSVAGDDDVVPVVVVEGLVGVAFDQVGPISQVGHVVQVAGRGESLTWDGLTIDNKNRKKNKNKTQQQCDVVNLKWIIRKVQ